MCKDERTGSDPFRDLKISRGDAHMLYALSVGSYTIRFQLRLDQPINPEQMRRALDQTAKRYPYFCVTLKKNEQEYYYEKNDAPIALLHTREMVTLNAKETNGHIWAVCYDEDTLFIDLYHGRTDGTGAYFLISTLLYYYLIQQAEIPDSEGIRTLDQPVTEAEIYDPLEDLPLVDLGRVKRPPVPPALGLMKEQNLKGTGGKGLLLKLMIPEKAFIPFSKENDASPGIMVCALMARAVRWVNPDTAEAVVGSYVVNARPMLHAGESFHNCVNRVILSYDERVAAKPLTEQCTIFRGKTFLQSDEDNIRRAMTISSSLSHMILNIPTLDMKVQAARKAILGVLRGISYTVSYVGKWKFPQLGEHIREFWLQTPIGEVPLIELSAVNGQIFVSMMQAFESRIYYDAFLKELREQGIPYSECEAEPIRTADILM